MLKVFLLALTLLACSKGKHEHTPPASINADVSAKRQLYCDLSKAQIEALGYAGGKCDGLLFTSLRAIGCADIGISQFQNDEGRWFRNPEKDCFIVDPVTGGKKNQGADSSISKDMLVGAMSYMWWKKDKSAVDATVSYGEKHAWVMGQGIDAVAVISKCTLSPTLISTLYDIQKGLAQTPALVSTELINQIPLNTGFRAHLDVLHALLVGSVHRSLPDNEYQNLKMQAERQPNNLLYQAAYAQFSGGNMEAVTEQLLHSPRFPNDRLPTTAEYCTDYLWQRDESPKDWEACTDKPLEAHDGTDFAFAAAIVDGTYFNPKD